MFKLIRSLIQSTGKALAQDPEVKKFIERHQRFFSFIHKRLSPEEKFGLYLTLGVLTTIVFIWLFFGLIFDLIGHKPLIASDLRIINLIQTFRAPTLNQIMLFITYLGNWQVVLAGLLLTAFFLFLLKRWYYLITLVVSVGGGELFILLFKNIIQRPRPSLINALAPESSFSFPSGHSFIAFSFYGLLAYFLFRTIKNKFLKALSVALGAGIILAIGFSRIYLGAHWPSDVLAGYASGAAWLASLITALEIRKKFYASTRQNQTLKKSFILGWADFLFLLWLFGLMIFFQTHPLASQPPPKINQIIISEKEIPQNLFINLPRSSEDITGTPMEPINLIIVARKNDLNLALAKTGWLLADPITFKTFWKILATSFLGKPYNRAPGTPSFWNGQPNELTYEKPTAENSARERHHIHFWQSPFILPDKRIIWFATAHFDKNVEFSSRIFLPTHTIDPAVDKERNKIKEELLKTDSVEKWQEFQIVEPTLGANQAGDQFFTDGKSYVILLKD